MNDDKIKNDDHSAPHSHQNLSEADVMEKMVRGDDDVIFEEYVNPNRFNSKFWLGVTTVILLILTGLFYKIKVLDKIIPPEELKASINIFDVNSKWVVKEEVHEKDFHGIVLVPQITFKVRNIGKIDLQHVYMLGVFRLENRPKALGEDYLMALKKPLEPGEESDLITLTSSFGYRATSKKAFAQNSKEWVNAAADIFIKSGSTRMILLHTYYILRKIDGYELKVDIKMT